MNKSYNKSYLKPQYGGLTPPAKQDEYTQQFTSIYRKLQKNNHFISIDLIQQVTSQIENGQNDDIKHVIELIAALNKYYNTTKKSDKQENIDIKILGLKEDNKFFLANKDNILDDNKSKIY